MLSQQLPNKFCNSYTNILGAVLQKSDIILLCVFFFKMDSTCCCYLFHVASRDKLWLLTLKCILLKESLKTYLCKYDYQKTVFLCLHKYMYLRVQICVYFKEDTSFTEWLRYHYLKKAKKTKLWLLLGENDRKLGKPLSSTIILILKATPYSLRTIAIN